MVLRYECRRIQSDDKRTPVTENDIPDIIERFKNLDKEAERKRTDQSFMVPKKIL